MKRFSNILIILCLMIVVCASAESSDLSAGSCPDFNISVPDMPDFKGFDNDNWLSGFSMPEGWGDLSLDGFDGFPEGWDSITGSDMNDWEERFNAFRDQVGVQSGENAFPGWESGDFDTLKEAFENSGFKQEETEPNGDIRDLFLSTFGNSPDQTITAPEFPVDTNLSKVRKKPSPKYSDTSGYRQITAIADAVGIPGFTADLSLGSLPEFSSTAPTRNPDTIKNMFAENITQLTVSMDASPDRYISLYSSGKSNQKASDANEMEALTSLYESIK